MMIADRKLHYATTVIDYTLLLPVEETKIFRKIQAMLATGGKLSGAIPQL